MLKDYHGSFQEVVKDLFQLNKAVFLEKEKVARNAGIALTSQDARLVALDGIQQNLVTVGYWINALISLKSECQGQGPNWEKTYLGKLGVGPDIYPGDSHRTGKIEDRMLGVQFGALVTLIHFKIDNLFYNTLRALGETPTKSFNQNTANLIGLVGLPKNGAESDALEVFSQVRNSFHNNGIHRNADFHVTVFGVRFDFIRGRRVECASWAHILHLTEVNVRVLGAILSSAPMRQVNGEIKDDFASGGVQP